MSSVLGKRDVLVTTRKEFLVIQKQIDQKIKEATALGATETAADLTAFKRELLELTNNPSAFAGRDMIAEAMEIHPDVARFTEKFTGGRSKIGPEAFKQIAGIMSEKLRERAPVTDNFIDFYKRLAQDYARSTKKVRIPWVTFDGKTLYQDYRPKLQSEIRFYDPESRRYIRNIYQMDAEDGKLLGKNVGDVRLGFGVNGGMYAVTK